MDTLREVLKHKYSIDARFESRNSFYDHRLISVSGIRLGVAFQRKLRFGGGFSWLNTQLSDDILENPSGTAETPKILKFAYVCYYIDFVFYKTKRWQLSVPIQAGTGASWYQFKSGYNLGNEARYFFVLYEPGITAQFKLLKWAGLGTDVAYRFVLGRKAGERLNSPTYSFKLMIWFDQLFYEACPNSDITKKYGPGFW